MGRKSRSVRSCDIETDIITHVEQREYESEQTQRLASAKGRAYIAEGEESWNRVKVGCN